MRWHRADTTGHCAYGSEETITLHNKSEFASETSANVKMAGRREILSSSDSLESKPQQPLSTYPDASEVESTSAPERRSR